MSLAADVARRRAAIDAATAASRRQYLTWRTTRAAFLKALLEQLGDDIAANVAMRAGADGRLTVESLPVFEDYLVRRLGAFEDAWLEALDVSLRAAAAFGAEVLADTPVSTRIGRVDDVLRKLRAFTAADGLQLSDRLWRIRKGATDRVAQSIRSAVIRGQSADQAALDLARRGLPIPRDLKAAQAAAGSTRIAHHARDLLTKRGQESILFNYERVLVTEMNRAYTEAFVDSVFDAPDVVGVRFTLSPLHPKPDVCDYYATVNLHGLGPGVYPKGAHPYPAHPMTLSFLVAVFASEVTQVQRDGKQTPFQWLGAQNAALQRAVLGGDAKFAAFKRGELLETELRAPWRAVAARLGKPAP